MQGHVRQAASFFIVGVAMLAAPFVWRPALATWGPDASRFVPSYLPALEPSRVRDPFNPQPIEDLKELTPDYVVIGDSMAGRIDPDQLTRLTGETTVRIVQNATGPSYWFLALKNYVVASGVHPKRVFVFFRDTNLTDVLFRLDGAYRYHLDEVAGDREDELNRVVAAKTSESWYTVHQWLDRLYGIERTRAWIDHTLTSWPAGMVGGTGRQDQVLARVNAAFALEKFRSLDEADLASAEERSADFDANVQASPLPLFLSLARERDLHLCFVRVLRRPANGEPQQESPAIRRYVKALGAYLAARGADLIDDRDDPALARLPYADGDHITEEARAVYTERFSNKIRTLSR